MQPEQATFLRDFFAQSLEQEAQITRRVLAAVPATGNDYRPDPKSRTGLELAWHIASSDAWFLEGIFAAEFDLSKEPVAVPADIRSGADVVAYYEKSYIARITEVRKLDGAALTKVVNFAGLFDFPLVVYLALLNNHQIHHRGQLSSYLRAMGAKVPSIYGGSADEPMEMGASA
jgi:uncharacterized damage-inducible protein DinB